MGHARSAAAAGRRRQRRRGPGAGRQGRRGPQRGRHGRDPGRRASTSSAATAAADAIKALKPGDPVTLTYGLKDAAARQMQWAIGTNKPLVHERRRCRRRATTSVAPRTAIGFKDGGKTMFLLITDGRQTQAALGTTLEQTARHARRARRRHRPQPRRRRLDDARRPRRSAARPRRCATRRPTATSAPTRPASASSSRPATARSTARRLARGAARLPGPAPHADRVGPRRPRHAVRPATSAGRRRCGRRRHRSGRRHRRHHRHGEGRRRQAGREGPRPARAAALELSNGAPLVRRRAPSLAHTLKVTGRDDQGYTAPIELQDMTLDYDHAADQGRGDRGGLAARSRR